MPEHSAITDPNIHEPKGVAAADAGEVYIADGAGSGDWTKIPKRVFKTSDQSITSSTTFTDCTGLSFPVAASTNYVINLQLIASVLSGGGKVAVTAPASPTELRFNGVSTTDDVATLTILGNRNVHEDHIIVLRNGANAGTFAIRVAQNSSDAGASVFRLGSYIEYSTF